MASVMLSLGGFKFHIESAAYNELIRTWQWRWANQSRVGVNDLLQYTGQAATKISLSGRIAPLFRDVGTQQVSSLASLGNQAKPLLLISGLGDVLGYWVMTNLTENNNKFIQGGLPRGQSFSLELSFYGDNLSNP